MTNKRVDLCMRVCVCVCVCEVVERANNVKYGLCASLWTSDINKAHRVARKLEVGVEISRICDLT